MKLLIVTPDFPPNSIGGGAIHVHNLVKCLHDRFDKVIVFALAINEKALFGPPSFLKFLNVYVYYFPILPFTIPACPYEWLSRHPTTFSLIPMLLKELEEHDIIVHIHGFGHFVSDISCILARLKKRPCVLTIHGFPMEPYKRGPMNRLLYSFYENSLGSLCLKSVDKVIAISQSIAKECIARGVGKEKVHVIYNAIDINEILNQNSDFDFRKEYRLEESKIIICIGRLIRAKGFQHVLGALPTVKEKIPNIKAVFIGQDGGYYSELRKLVRQHKLKDSVLFLGWFDEIKKRAAMKAADIVVVPSLVEPFGLITLEAMAFGKPIIASNTGGLSEILKHGHTALMFPPEDESRLASHLTLLLSNDRVAQALAQNAKIEIIKYNTPRMAEETMKVYQELVKL